MQRACGSTGASPSRTLMRLRTRPLYDQLIVPLLQLPWVFTSLTASARELASAVACARPYSTRGGAARAHMHEPRPSISDHDGSNAIQVF